MNGVGHEAQTRWCCEDGEADPGPSKASTPQMAQSWHGCPMRVERG